MILSEILTTKAAEVKAARSARPLQEVRAAAMKASAPRGFYRALSQPGHMHVIAEVKKASPSKGLIRADFDPAAIAQAYESGGATCLSVLTDEQYFQGSLEHLRAVRAAVSLPLLRKDFIIDEYQIYAAREAGADAILLIASAFVGECAQGRDTDDFGRLAILVDALGMDVITEVHTAEELEAALDTIAVIIGINNRDLKTFQTSLDVTINLAPRVPKDRLLISESGIATTADLDRLATAGARAVLVGESLMRQTDVAQALRTLIGPR